MFGHVVRGHRQRLGLTQEELADKAGVGLRTIRDIETGRIGRPRQATVRRLAEVFGLRGVEREQLHELATPAGHHHLRAPHVPDRPDTTQPTPLPPGPVRLRDRPTARTADDAGLSALLRSWMTPGDQDEHMPDAPASDQHGELAALRKEKHRLQVENEILRRAAAYLALAREPVPPE